jgi:hypothetical protein
LIVLMPRSAGTFSPWPAADVESSVGAIQLPELFLTLANVNPFWRA